VRELGRSALAVPTDVMGTDQIRAMVEQAGPSVSAGSTSWGSTMPAASAPALPRPVGAVLAAAYRPQLVQHAGGDLAAVPIMIRGGRGGAIVNVTSIELARRPNYASNAACKAGMNNFTRTMRSSCPSTASHELDRPRLHRHAGPQRQHHRPGRSVDLDRADAGAEGGDRAGTFRSGSPASRAVRRLRSTSRRR